MRILLVEPYYGGSHRAWADGYAAGSRHDVTLVTHDAQFWKWRLHGAHLTLAEELDAIDAPPDVVLASSMMNVAGFLGAARDTIGAAPVAVYFHESQFTYPLSPLDRPDETYPMINWSSAAVADLVLFNSEYHRHTFFEQVERFLRQFPDRRHSDLVAEVEKRSKVLPIGIDASRFAARSDPGEAPLLLWNQRWEHDKGPDELVVMLEHLMELDVQFHVAVVGERFVSTPPGFERLPALLGDRLVEFGFLPDREYAELLRRADVVVSTAHQEFFGVAVVEAMAAGAFPVLPGRLVYPEHIPLEYRDRCLYGGTDDLVEKVRWALEHRAEARAIAAKLSAAMAHFDWPAVAPRYDAALEALVGP
jgi:glycosyltransferase involved in cell wall biosynthesis